MLSAYHFVDDVVVVPRTVVQYQYKSPESFLHVEGRGLYRSFKLLAEEFYKLKMLVLMWF